MSIGATIKKPGTRPGMKEYQLEVSCTVQMHFLHLTGKRVVFCMQDVNIVYF
jgi:hypothetical protein